VEINSIIPKGKWSIRGERESCRNFLGKRRPGKNSFSFKRRVRKINTSKKGGKDFEGDLFLRKGKGDLMNGRPLP